MKKYDVAIIGGGVSGLNSAYQLSKAGKKVIVIEKNKSLGGMLRSIDRKDYSIEEFYHHIFENSVHAINLIDKLKLNLTWKDASTAFYYPWKDKSNFFTLTVPTDLLKFKPLTFFEKLKLGIFLLRMKLIKNPGYLDNIPAERYIIKNVGNSVYEKFFKPLLSAKYGKNLHRISTGWFIDRINIRNKRGYKGEILGYVEGGFELIIKRLKEEILKNKGEIGYGKPVKKVTDRFVIDFGKKISADYIINTTSSSQFSKLFKFPDDYQAKLKSLKNQGVICIVLGLKKKLTNFYWTNLIKEDISFRAIIEHTNFQPLSKYKEHIMYLASYPDVNSELWNISDKEVFERYFKDLSSILPVKKEDVNWFKVIKERDAGLIYETGILKNILPVETPIKGLYFAGMSNSYPDRNLEQSLILSTKAVNLILKK